MGQVVFILFPLESDALGSLLLGYADLFQGVGWERVGRGQQWGFGAVASFVSDEGDHSDGAVGEGEAAER